MLTLQTLGKVVCKIVHKFVYMVETNVLGRRKPQRVKIKSFILIFTLMVLTLCAAGMTQVYLEGWTLIEGVYAWFAILSTIGYGDYVPNWSLLLRCEESIHSKIIIGLVISAYALPSLAALSLVAGVLSALVEALEEFEVNFKARYWGPRLEYDRIETVMVNVVSSVHDVRSRSVTL